MNRAQYLFGDSNPAAQRLRLLASVYRESTRTFLMAAQVLRASSSPWTWVAAPFSLPA
jgi:hypothetical protein